MGWFRKRFRTYGPEMILDALEERIVLDATVDQGAQQNSTNTTGTGSTADAHTTTTSTGTTSPNHNASSDGLHVILVSNDVKNADQIVSAKVGDAQVIVFDSQHDGLDAINAKLTELVQASGKKISTIAVLGHGQDGVIEVGADHITEGNLVKFVASFETLAANLTENAQIEFYGCSIAAGTAGKTLVNDIATYTHATVFASTNDTGGGQRGDWNLEYASRYGAQATQVLDTTVLATADVTLVFSNTPFSWTDDPAKYAINWGDIDTSDPAGTAGFPNGSTGTGHAEYWTFTVPTGGGYVSFGAQTVYPMSQNNTAFLDPLLRLRSATTGMIYVDDWVGPGNVDLDGNGSDDVNVWDARLVDVYLPAGTYTLECTHYIWTGNNAFRNTGAYTLYSSFRTDLSSDFTPLQVTYDTSQNHLNNEVVSRPVLDVTEPVGFHTYDYDVSGSFGKPPDDTVHYRLVGTTPGFLQSIAIDPNTGIVTFTEAATPVTGSVNVTVEAYSGSLVSDQTFAFKTVNTYDLPSAQSNRFWVDQNGSITFWVTGYDPDLHANSQVRFVVDTDYSVAHGTLTTNTATLYHDASGHYYQQYTYTPTSGYYGLDGFHFTFQTQGGTTWKGYSAGPDGQGQAVGVAPTTDANSTYVVQFADLNNDGFLDIVEGNYGSVNKYYLNDGHGNFPVGHALGTDASNTTCIAVADVNRDGWLDVVAGNYSQYDMEYLNQGANSSGTWLGLSNGVTIPGSNSGQEYAIVLGDLNGDGYPDLVRGNDDTQDYVHLNLGGGTFDSGHAITTSSGSTRALALGDVNRDGFLDLVDGKYTTGRNMLFLGNGDGTFGAPSNLGGSTSGEHTTAIALGDVNNDGWLDIVTSSYAGTSTSTAYRTKLYMNSGSGTFTAETKIGGNNFNAYDVKLADADNDGDLDIVLGVYGSNSEYWLNSGTGTFSGNGTNITSVTGNTRSIAVGDVDGDGDADVLYGIDGSLDRLMVNQGFNTGTGTYHTTAPGMVELNVGLLKYPSFQADNSLNPAGIYQNGSGVGWHFSDENPLSFASAFATINNRSTLSPMTSVYDHYDSITTGVTSNELQVSFGLPLKVMDREAGSGEQIALLLTNQPHHATLWQDVTLPRDTTIAGVDLQWRMAYQNDYSYLNSTTPFDATYQYIAVYVYTPDASGHRPAGTQPLWITTNGRDAGVVSSLQDYTVHLPASLVPTASSKSVRVEFEFVAQNYFFEVAIDDFVLIPVKHSTGSALPAVVSDYVPVTSDFASNRLVSGALTANTISTLSTSTSSQNSASVTSASLMSVLLSSTTSSTSSSDAGTTVVDLGLTGSASTSPSSTAALEEYGFAPFVFNTDSSGSKPVADQGSSSSVASTPDSALASSDPTAILNAAAQPDLAPADAEISGAGDPGVDRTADNGDAFPAAGIDFRQNLALILDPAEMSALDVLHVQAASLGMHLRTDVKDMSDRLAAGEALAFDLDAIRLYDL